MNATEFIRQLDALVAIYGDLPVINEYGQEIDSPEYNTDNGVNVFLVGFDES